MKEKINFSMEKYSKQYLPPGICSTSDSFLLLHFFLLTAGSDSEQGTLRAMIPNTWWLSVFAAAPTGYHRLET